MQGALLFRTEIPASIVENLGVGPGSEHFGNKEIVALLLCYLRDDFTFEPGNTAVNARCCDGFSRRGGDCEFRLNLDSRLSLRSTRGNRGNIDDVTHLRRNPYMTGADGVLSR